MSLYKRGNVWWTKFMIDGELQRLSTHMTNKNEARDREREMISQARSGEPPKPRPLALGEFLRGLLPALCRSELPREAEDAGLLPLRRPPAREGDPLETRSLANRSIASRSANSFTRSAKRLFRRRPSIRRSGLCAGP